MPNKLINYGFSGGVFAEEFHGRPDLEKYGLGLADAVNFFIDYRGGASSRAGLQHVDVIPDGQNGVVFSRFRFNNRISNTYVLVWTAGKLRFIQDGAFVLEPPKTIVSAPLGTYTVTAHGYSAGDILKIDDRLFEVYAPLTNSFQIKDLLGAVSFYIPVGTEVARVYTKPTPYAADALRELVFRQRRSEVIVTHPEYPQQILTRYDHADWTFAALDLSGQVIASPTGISATASGAGSAGIAYTVTAVDSAGRETYLQSISILTAIVNYTTTAGHVTFSWNPVSGAVAYRIYRSIVMPGGTTNNLRAQQLGYIGLSYSTNFVDNNIIPNFGITPPIKANPFVPGQIQEISVLTAGSGYSAFNPTPTIGSGFNALTFISAAGGISGFTILDAGKDYTDASLRNFTFTGGTGATYDIVVAPLTGTYPSASLFFNQRLWFFGTENFPLRLYGSRPEADRYSFSFNQIVSAADPIILDIDSSELTPIRYAEIVNDSMFVFTDQSVWQVVQEDNGYRASFRTENGIATLRPLTIGREIVFGLSGGTGVWALRPSNLPNYYIDVDVGLFSSHFLQADNPIVSWAFAREPFRTVWAVRDSGDFLSFTYVAEHNVYAWSRHETDGEALCVETVQENGNDTAYFAIRRGSLVYAERMDPRRNTTVEDVWAVDAGLRSDLVFPNATLTVVGNNCTVNGMALSGVDVGKHIRAGGGRGEVLSVPSAGEMVVAWDVPIEGLRSSGNTYSAGQWSLTPLVTTFSGLSHLEGRSVEVFADGSFVGMKTVSGGAITLDTAASYVLAGLPYTGFIEMLPLVAPDIIIEDRRKRLVELTPRIHKTTSLEYSVDDLQYPVYTRTDEALRAYTRFQSGARSMTAPSNWRQESSIKFHKVGPSAVSVLNVIFNLEIGDDEN